MDAVETLTDELTAFDLVLIKQLCLPHKIICANIGISHGALRVRLNRLMQKLGVENQRALLVKALQLHTISIDEIVYREFNGKATLS